MNSRFVRIAETDRIAVEIRIDGEPAQTLAGDTLLVALLMNGRRVRDSEFGDGPRRLLPDGRMPRLLGLDRRRRATASLLNASAGGNGGPSRSAARAVADNARPA